MNRNIRWVGLAAMTLALPVLAQVQDPGMTDPAQSERPRTDAPQGTPTQSERANPGSQQDAAGITKSWPANSKVTAKKLIDKYGPPDAATGDRLVWNDHGKWTQIRLFREGATDDFPTTHRDIVENTVQYDVPQDKAGELTKFYPGLSVDRAAGTMSARSDSEEANILALNLADEIVKGKRDVDSARDYMRSTLRKTMAGKSSPYTDSLRFPVSDRGAVKD
ncbi:MAG TPA: hypothetical protein VN915_08800 [Elusimicrobiota bacterium]|nr:hypothetical protein [Elusimicrobiota bacterium]